MAAAVLLVLAAILALSRASASPTNAAAADRITLLPGQRPVNFSMYSGYVTVDAAAGARPLLLAHRGLPSRTPASAPLVLWLNGGPRLLLRRLRRLRGARRLPDQLRRHHALLQPLLLEQEGEHALLGRPPPA
ncbi:hypothetical protein ACQ4PT_067499 [Festuca glaucescens]